LTRAFRKLNQVTVRLPIEADTFGYARRPQTLFAWSGGLVTPLGKPLDGPVGGCLQILLDFVQLGFIVSRGRFGLDDGQQVPAVPRGFRGSKGLADQSFEPVPADRVSQAFGRANGQAGPVQSIWGDVNYAQAATCAAFGLKNPVDVLFAAQTSVRPKSQSALSWLGVVLIETSGFISRRHVGFGICGHGVCRAVGRAWRLGEEFGSFGVR